MNARSVDVMDPAAFGQMTEQIMFGRGNYGPDIVEAMQRRLATGETAVGRVSITGFVHDGEVGAQIAVIPLHTQTLDVLAQGI